MRDGALAERFSGTASFEARKGSRLRMTVASIAVPRPVLQRVAQQRVAVLDRGEVEDDFGCSVRCRLRFGLRPEDRRQLALEGLHIDHRRGGGLFSGSARGYRT